MPWPAPGFFTGFATQGQLRQALDDLLARSRAQIGADGVENATIASGAIAPSKGSVRLYGEGAAADTLVSLDVAAYDEGQLVELRIGDVNQPVTIQHASSPASGQFSLLGGIDYQATALGQRIVVQRTGSYWLEWSREGRPAALAFSFGSGWSAVGSASYRKDETGEVQLAGLVTHAGPSDSSVVATLAAGFRPLSSSKWPLPALIGSTRVVAQVQILATGEVTFENVPAGAPGAAVVLYLDAVRFRAEQ